MTLFLTLLPLYLLGNLHCLGMCGPLVMMIGSYRYKWFYFLGRTLSFSLAGLLSGAFGAVIQGIFSYYHVSAAASFLLGGIILYMGAKMLWGKPTPVIGKLHRLLLPFQQALSLLLLRDTPFSTFLFGLFTVTLPCGQTLIVFSAIALSGNAWTGLFNGFAFALLTSPSLWIAMQSHDLLSKAKTLYKPLIGWFAIVIGIIGFCRGFAEMGWIPHVGYHPLILF